MEDDRAAPPRAGVRSAEGLAEEVRRALLEAALAAYEDARMAGLCAEGAWEAAIGAARSLDLGPLLERRIPGED